MIYGDFVLLMNIFFIFNNRKITRVSGREKNCLKAETETHQVQKPAPNTSADF